MSAPDARKQPIGKPVPAMRIPGLRRPILRILFIYNDAANIKRCLQELGTAQFQARVEVTLTPEQFTERLRSECFDVVVAEYPGPNGEGIQALKLLFQMETQKQLPLIFITDQLPREMAVDLIAKGAADCIEMCYIGHLPVSIRRALDERQLREQRDRAEKKLRHSQANYRALVGNPTYGICRCDEEGTFLRVNQTLMTMLGYVSRDELLAVNLISVIIHDSRQRNLWTPSGQEDQVGPVQTDWKRKDGTNLTVLLSARKVASEEGHVDYYEIIVQDVTQQHALEENLRQQATTDPLTGLANYRHLVDVLDSEIKRSRRTSREFALLLLDLDGLKRINDCHGHMTGSQALRRLADALCICCRDIDTPARFGGDEFALVLPETGTHPANVVVHRICEQLGNDGKEPKLSVSIGTAIYPRDGEDIDALLAAADRSMYSIKRQARSVSLLIVQDNAEKRALDLKAAAVLDKS